MDAFYERKFALERRIEAWEKESGERVDAGDDRFSDLVAHIVGLGRTEYEATMADPRRALARANARDYQESFAYR